MPPTLDDTCGHSIYENKTLQPHHIRLLTILPKNIGDNDESPVQCELNPVLLDDRDPVPYTALSYTWGQSHDRLKIVVNGKDFLATSNLKSALEHFRNTQDPIPTLWVDAICINQNHNGEKGEQVALMQSIFTKAKETWVWLGVEANDSDKAVDMINDLSHVYRDSCQEGNTDPEKADKTRWGSLRSRGLETHLVAFDHLLSRDYWYRVWVVQEIALSKNLVVFCGSRKFFWDSLVYTAYLLNRQIESRNTFGGDSQNSSRGVVGGIQRILCIQSVRNDFQDDVETKMRDSLLSLLCNHRSTGATNEKDKYIALTGLVQNRVGTTANAILGKRGETGTDNETETLYDENVEVGYVYTLACHLLANEKKRHKPLDFLDAAGLPRNYPMPSWVPDWSVTGAYSRPSPLLYWQLATKKHKDHVLINAPGESCHIDSLTFAFHNDSMLQARGRRIDVVSAVMTRNKTNDTANGELVPRLSQDHSMYPTGETLSDALWRTLVLGRALADGLPAPEVWGDVFYEHISHPQNLSSPPSFVHRWWTACRNFQFGGLTLEEIAQGRSRGSFIPENSSSDKDFSQFSAAFVIANGYRKLATTEKGFLGLVPLDAKVGDIVVILVDCSAPAVLRQRKNKEAGYEFIGICYMHGIMHGEAVDDIHVEDRFPETFKIY